MSVDHILKLYSQTVRSPYLHYGFWDDPDSIDSESLTLDEFVQAQERYIEHLTSFIPEDVSTVLDVGCGIGGNAAYLLERGYQVEALSPDTYQESVIHERFNGQLPFYKTKFENFDPPKTYDLVLESESAAYIQQEKGFAMARTTIRDGGYILVSDYFVHTEDQSGSPHLKSSHRLKPYLNAAQRHGFETVREFDQTDNTMPTLDLARSFMSRFIEPSMEYAAYSVRRKYPRTFAIMKKMFGPRLTEKLDQMALIDSNQFKKYRKYMIFLFRKISL